MRKLRPREKELAIKAGVRFPDRIRIKVDSNSRFLRLIGAIGLCLGNYVFIERRFYCNPLLLHEFTHVKQAQSVGYIRYALRTLYEYIFIGYEDAPMELEARKAEKRG